MKKVLVVFPWKFVDSPYYRNLINYPPEGYYYLNKMSDTLIINPKKFSIYSKIKEISRKVINKTGIHIPIVKYKKYNVDLIHCARCILLNKKNYVVDVEIFYSLSYNLHQSLNRQPYRTIVRKLLERENCKKILPWTYASYYSFPEEIRKKLKDKFEVLYPAVPEPKIKKVKHDKLTILFIGRYFYYKGGHYALEVFRKLKEKYDIEAILISMTIPDSLIKKYEKFGIKIYKSIPSDLLYNEIYPKTDILFYPGFSDTFGFAFIEALSYGIPVVTYDGFARREIIEDGKNGTIIENKWRDPIRKLYKDLIEEFYNKTKELIESNLNEFSKNAYKIYKEKFSIEVRNKKLKEIYDYAIEN